MDSVHIRRFAAAAVLLAATASHAFAQVTLVAEPASLTFNVTGGTPATQDLLIRTSNNTAAQVTLPPQPTGISWQIVSAPNGTGFTPITLRVGATAGAVSTSLTFSGSGLSPIQVPITVTGGGGSGGAAFSATPGSLQFNQTGTTPPLGQTIFISSNTGIVPMYSVAISPDTTPWLTTSPAHATTSSSPTLTVTPVSSALGTGTYNANIILTPQNVAALPITIPVFLSVNQAGTTQLTVSPSPIVFTYPAGTTTAQSQNVQVSSSPAVAFTAALSANLASFAQVTPPSATTPSQLTVSIVFPQAVPAGTSGTLTLTPTAGSGFGITAIPIQINAGGGTVGSFIVNPSTLTFNGIVGATTTVPAQNVTVASADGTQQFFQATATSTNNFLFVSTGTNATPATVSVGVNMASITTPGTYTGTITFSPFTGGLPTTLQVTLNATSSITVTPTPASVTVTAGTGTAAVQQNVSLTSTTADVPFTTSATTTSGGQWLSVTTANTTLPGTITISANPANLALGTYNGTVTVMSQNATVATIPVTFTVTTAATMTVAPATLTFAHQTTSTTPPPAQAVQITTSGAAITWNATATSTGGWLQVSPATGTTPGTLNVSVNPTGLAPGAYTGTVSVSSSSATNSPQTINVTLNVATPAIPQISSVVNAASNAPTSAAPGLIATIFGSDLGPTPPVSAQVNPQGLIDTTLGGLRVLFDGVPAPVLYASPTQVNFVVPYEIAGRFSTRMQVEARSQRSREIELRVAETAPGVFTISGTGAGQGAVLNQNGTVNGAANPEQRGNVIVIYATGHGQTNPIGTNGRVLPGSDLRRPTSPIVVRIGGRIAEVTYAGSAPGMVSGALQVNARVPMDAPTGANVVVEVQAGVNISQANVTVALQ